MRLMVWVLQDQTPAQMHSPATASTMPIQAAAKPGNIPQTEASLMLLLAQMALPAVGKHEGIRVLHVQSKNPSESNPRHRSGARTGNAPATRPAATPAEHPAELN